MALPLLVRANEDDGTFVHLTRQPSCGVAARSRMPDRVPDVGEQYRFHVDMASCIGCKCCVVACNEQNGNPASINWRRVSELEGGRFPATRRAYFSMGCNHCVDPTCLEGCPVDAYTKDPSTGIVRHSAETCIGCQYCTWTCSYGVPQFNADRGVVGKCDMCHGRLSVGAAPACVSACPEGAIAIEIVNVAEWRAAVADRVSGMPTDDRSVSTTRVTVSPLLPDDAQAVDLATVVPGDPHWPLVAMTVLTQLSAGAFVAILTSLAAVIDIRTTLAAAIATAVAGLALAAATLHLGRPIHAYRAMKMWRRSWLSREVVLFGAFAHVAGLLTACLFFGWPGVTAIAAGTAVLGVAGVTASAYIYRVGSRPSWDTPRTLLQFLLTGVLLGALFAGASGIEVMAAWRVLAIASACAIVMLLADAIRLWRGSRSVELRSTARLLTTTFRTLTGVRVLLLLLGGVLLPLVSGQALVMTLALVLAGSSELVGRYLFFVSAVPKHMTAPYLPAGSQAA